MARKPGRGTAKPKAKRGGDGTEYLVSSSSDRSYAGKAHQRAVQQGRRRLVIRLAILAVLIFIGAMWGPDVWRMIRVRGQITAEEFEDVGDNIRDGTERRSSFDADEITR